jgi:hypothetical protein
VLDRDPTHALDVSAQRVEVVEHVVGGGIVNGKVADVESCLVT